MLTFKFRLYPDKTQQTTLWLVANRLNKVYNDFLNDQIEYYKEHKKFINFNELFTRLPAMKADDSLLASIHSQNVQQAVHRLKKAFKAFYRLNKVKKGNGYARVVFGL